MNWRDSSRPRQARSRALEEGLRSVLTKPYPEGESPTMSEDERINEGEELAAPELPEAVAIPVVASVAAEPRPALAAPWRALLYLIACAFGLLIGFLVAGLLAAIWLLARGGGFTPEQLSQNPGLGFAVAIFGMYPVLVLVTCLFVWWVD